MTRTLRSKHARALLWQSANGLCQRCGQPLGDDWEADHIVPWSVARRTNVHEMQALCRSCNRKKGSGVQLRRHQQAMLELARDWAFRRSIPKFTLANVVTAGGKSQLPVIAASELMRAGMVDKVCWVVPRISLRTQAEEAFGDQGFRRLLGHSLEIRQSENEARPSRDASGFVITYQAIASGTNAYIADDFALRRYLLVLDEPHHLRSGGEWANKIKPLVDAAAGVVLMTGTLERERNERVEFIPYRDNGDGTFSPDADAPGSPSFPVIRYSRKDAIEDRAIRKVEFRHIDGNVSYVDRSGQKMFTDLLNAGRYGRDALYTALNTDYAEHLLRAAVLDWQQYRNENPFAKLLVVAHSQSAAREHLRWLAGMKVQRSGIAISDESKAALETIERFKKNSRDIDALDALVTVQMAYEGLDVPQITHIACLTHIRSRPWIEQMIGRGMRLCKEWDGGWERQFCIVFAPDDPLFNEVADQIRRDQDAIVREDGHGPGKPKGGDEFEPTFIRPESGEATAERSSGMDASESLDADESEAIRAIADRYGVYGTRIGLQKLFDDYGIDWRAEVVQVERPTTIDNDAFVPRSVREPRLRRLINDRCRAIDRASGRDWGYANGVLKKTLGKGLPEMDLDELERAYVWIRQQSRSLGIDDEPTSYSAD